VADVSEVSTALVNLISAAIYPTGINNPSVVGFGVKIYAGWPDPVGLETDLKANIATVSVYPRNDEKMIDRLLLDWTSLSVNTPTLTATVSGQTLTIGGTVSLNYQFIGLMVDGVDYVYVVQTGDTLNSIAANIATLAGGVAVGAVVTFSSSYSLIARVGFSGISIKEISAQQRTYQITVWANCWDKRDPVGIAVEQALKPVYRVLMPDGFYAILSFKGSHQDDSMQLRGVYKRDILFNVEYSTTATKTDYSITIPQSHTEILGQTNTVNS